jgi:hypothetical protein
VPSVAEERGAARRIDVQLCDEARRRKRA